MLREHQPNYKKLEHITPQPLEHLLRRLVRSDWHDDLEVQKKLIMDITAMLVAHDTQATTGTEFRSCIHSITHLFADLEQNGDVHCRVVQYPESDRTALIIAPSEDCPAIEEVINSFESGSAEQESVPIENTVIHFHIDTVPIARGKHALATLDTFFDPRTGLMYGRGPNDMKGQASLASPLARLAIKAGKKPPVFVITTDEETHGKEGGLKLLQKLKSTWLTIDWEPVAGHAGSYVDGILPGLCIGLPAIDHTTLADLVRVQSMLEQQFTKGMCLPMASSSQGEVLLGLSTHNLDHEPDELIDELLAVARWGKIVPAGYFRYSVGQSRKTQCELDPVKKKIVVESLRQHFPWQPSRRTVSHVSSSDAGYFGRLHRHAMYYGNIDTLTFMAYRNLPNVIDIGIDEAGGGRHSETEAAQLDQLVSLLHSTLAIHVKMCG